MRPWLQRPRVWAVLLATVVLIAFGGASFVRRVTAATPFVGVEWTRSSSGPVALQVHPGSPAAHAGLEEGDLLLKIDGRDVAHVLEADELGWKATGGESVVLEIRRGAEQRTLRLAPAWTPRTEPYIYLAVVGLAFLLSGAFIAIRWPDIRGGALYSALAACVFVHLTLSPTGRADTLDWTSSWATDLTGALWPALLLHVGLVLTRRTWTRRRLVLGVSYAIAAFLAGVAFWVSPATLGGAYRWRDPAAAIERLVDRPAYLWMSVAVLFTIGVLAKSYARSPSGMHRSQMRWMLWGLAVGLGPFVTLYAVPWSVGAAELPDWARFLAVMPMLLVPAAFTAALARYRLYDFDLLLLRVVAEVTAVFCTFAVLSVTVFLMRNWVGEFVPMSRGTSRYLALLAAAIAYPQLRKWVRAAVERAFYKQRYSYRATLLDWARELNAETDLDSLLGLVRTRVRDTLGIAEAEVLLRTGPHRFSTPGVTTLELDPALVARLEQQTSVTLEEGELPDLGWARYLLSLKVKDRLTAVLAIAERESVTEPLSTEDRALLGTLAAHAATAIEAARLVREVRQRAEEIGRLHAQQATILESSAVGLLLLDPQGRILAWNRALEAMYGLPREEALGQKLVDVFPLNVAHRLEREGREEGSRIFRLTMNDRDGRRMVVNIAITKVDTRGAEGEGGIVVTFDDVTQRVELEAQMLQHERLASLGLLAAGVAHEINTPLTGISSYTQLLLDGSRTDDDRQMLEKIENQTHRASGITRSLLSLARPEPTEFSRLDLNEAVTEVLQLFEPQVRRGSVTLRSSLYEGLEPVLGSRGKLQQVLLNLLLNARDAVGETGEIVVTTRAERGIVVLEVTDDGPGIADDDLPRIFDPFFTTKKRGRGTGLGLSITFGIVQEHRGRIVADTAADGRTLFRVELPTAERSQAMA